MRQSSLLVIFLIVFIDLVGFGIVIPILPYYAKNYGASGWVLGWLMTSYSLMQFLFSPFWGRISDHVGRRPVLLLSVLGTGVSLVILGAASSLKWLFIGRILAGFFGANLSTAYAYITDVTTEKDRAKGMGLLGAAFGLGFVFGPAIGGILSRYGYAAPMFAAAALSLFNLMFALVKLEEPHITPEMRYLRRFKRFDLESIRIALSEGGTRFAVITFFLVTLAMTQLEVTFALFMMARYKLNAESAGVILAIIGIIIVVIQGGLIGRLVAKYGEEKLIIFGSALSSLALLAFANVGSLYLAITALAIMAAGHGLLHPCLSSIASFGAEGSRRGITMGVFQSGGSLARILGPPCAGWLFDSMSWRSPFMAGSIFFAIAFLSTLLWWFSRKRNVEISAEVPS